MLQVLRSMSEQLRARGDAASTSSHGGHRSVRRAAACLLLSFTLLACGEVASPPESRSQSTGAPGFPVTVQGDGGSIRLDSPPERIISLSPTATEMLFTIEAGDQVVAVDDQSDYPPQAPTTKLSGYEPNIEAIARFEPDLVVAQASSGLKSLADLKIPLLVQEAAETLDDTYAQIEQLGAATGHRDEAAAEVETMRSRIEEILSSVPDLERPPTYYHELDDTYYSVTSETFIGQVYELAGLRNIADKAAGASSGYPQLSAEYIIKADPDFIFLADSECCNQSPMTVARRAGWSQISAVRNDRVVNVGDDISSRWGPRIVDFLEIVVEAVHSLEPASK